MSILSIENATMSAIEHAAVWLLGHMANSTASLNDLEPGSSLVQDALNIGTEAATTHGVQVPVIEKGGQLVLGAARDLSAMMMHTAGTLPQPDPKPEPEPEPEPIPQTKAEAKAEAAEAKAEAKAAAADEAASP